MRSGWRCIVDRAPLICTAFPHEQPCRVLSIRITYWRDEDMWLGYLDEFPKYMTQGYSFADLKDHLIDLMRDLESGIHIIASA